jgi:hypothetical protein
VNELRQFHEFVFAQFAVAVFVEPGKHLGWIRPLTASTCFRGRPARCFFAAALASFFAFAALTFGSHLLHLFFGLCLFLRAELAVFIGVEFLEEFLAHFGALAVVFFPVLVGRLSNRGQRQDAGR